MKKIIKQSIAILIAIISNQYSQAQTIEQQVISGCGATFFSSAIQSDYTVGEIITSTLIQGSFVFTQGFHQPKNGNSTGIIAPQINVNYSLYPNPARESITLELNTDSRSEVLINIVNIIGQQVYIQSDPVQIYPQYKQTFSIGQFAAGAYVLNIYHKSGGLMQAIKFIKKE